jgi:membrane-associated phospholipid phosphatase
MLAAMPRDRRPIGNRLLIAALLLLVLAALFYALWDRAIAEWAFHLPRSWANAARRLSALGEGVYWIVVVFAIGLAGVVRKKDAVAAWALETVVAIAGAGIAANVLKVVAGRARPRALDEDVWGFRFFEFGYRFNSFPSGHAAIAGAVAASICLARPAAWPAAALLWLLLAGGRVLTGSHFVSDVLAGGAVGIAVAVAVSRWDWLTARLTELARRMRTAPAAVPSSPVRDE